MEFGFGAPSRGPLASPENLVALAQKGEELGFEILTVSDHIVVPNSIASVYPYNESGSFVSSVAGEYMEQLTTISYIAGITSRIKLLTSVMVLPHRSPVLTAKILSTIDVLSNGRLIVGCGVGWMKEEFEAIGAPPYEERGAVGSEYIRAFSKSSGRVTTRLSTATTPASRTSLSLPSRCRSRIRRSGLAGRVRRR